MRPRNKFVILSKLKRQLDNYKIRLLKSYQRDENQNKLDYKEQIYKFHKQIQDSYLNLVWNSFCILQSQFDEILSEVREEAIKLISFEVMISKNGYHISGQQFMEIDYERTQIEKKIKTLSNIVLSFEKQEMLKEIQRLYPIQSELKQKKEKQKLLSSLVGNAFKKLRQEQHQRKIQQQSLIQKSLKKCPQKKINSIEDLYSIPSSREFLRVRIENIKKSVQIIKDKCKINM